MSKIPHFLTVSPEKTWNWGFLRLQFSPLWHCLYVRLCVMEECTRNILSAVLQNSVSTDVADQPAAIYLSPGDDQVCLKSWSLVWFQEVLPLPELNSDVNASANSLRVRFWHFARCLHLELSIILTVESHLQQKDKKDKSVAWHLVTSFYG